MVISSPSSRLLRLGILSNRSFATTLTSLLTSLTNLIRLRASRAPSGWFAMIISFPEDGIFSFERLENLYVKFSFSSTASIKSNPSSSLFWDKNSFISLSFTIFERALTETSAKSFG